MNIFLKPMKLPGLLVVLALLAASCSDFLKENPKDRIAITNYYTTEQDAISAVNAVYAQLNAQSGDTFGGVYHSSFWIAIGLASDEMANNQIGNTDADQLANFTYSPQNGTVYDVWKQHYKAITLANIAIERIPEIDMDVTLRTRLVNEAKFLRGLLYFNLVRMFGKIPLLTHVTEPLRPGVAEVEEIYTQIIQDLTDAEGLPATQADGRGRATWGAAKAILAKVYLTRHEYEKSAVKSKELIDSDRYELWDEYSDVFRIRNRGGKEAIFTVGFGDANGSIIFWEGGQFHVRLLPTMLMTAGITTNTLGWQVPSTALALDYAPADKRGPVTVFNKFQETVAGEDYDVTFDKYYFRKYWDVEAPKEFTNEQATQDFSVIRYADVLLMYAEAINESAPSEEAHDYLNMIRTRAGLGEVSGLSQDQFRAEVLEQRKLELAAEGHRWFDLVRTGKLQELVPVSKPGVIPQPRYSLFPIPQAERDLNTNLPQNDY
jgi:starch-binding outer membrane protein, SusD/RagB family